MNFDRASGILLHPTSLPGPYGIGDLGPEARRWVDFLKAMDCTLWQVLPLGPTGYGDSPYQSFSAFAGNPYLVSPELLQAEGWLEAGDLTSAPPFPKDQVDFGTLIPWKVSLLDQAFNRFQTDASSKAQNELAAFEAAQAAWLPDFALFMALKEAHSGAPWPTWEAPLRSRDAQALAQARQQYAPNVQRHIFRQFLFFRQWQALRTYAKEQGIRILGDAPIFVAHDSADVWAHPELFLLDEKGQPTVVAGVPPDYFSPTGQLWGNPLYRWELHAQTGYAWWLERLKAVLQMVDVVRLDHFRGFAGYWEIPAGMPTAEKGRWVPGPGAPFFEHLQARLGDLPIIAEDLGEITPDVFELRDRFSLPGMKILQFAFYGDPQAKFLPHNYGPNFVAYTGTHDNDTTLGWWRAAPESERDFCRRYLSSSGQDIVWDLIRAALASVAVFAVLPMQDFLELGTEARMNFPGRPSGNWSWRAPADYRQPYRMDRMRAMNFLFGRKPVEPQKDDKAKLAASKA